MRRVEDVLGKGWENHVEGQRLKADGDSFRQKLNTQELFDDWSRKVCKIFLDFTMEMSFSRLSYNFWISYRFNKEILGFQDESSPLRASVQEEVEEEMF